MALSTYDEIVQAIKDWSFRNDITDAQIDQFIYLTGNYANQLLRVPPMEHTELLTVEDGNRIAIPYDYLELRSLTAPWNSEGGIPLERIPWDQFVIHNNSVSNAGSPTIYFSRQGPYWFITSNLSDGQQITCHYYRSMPDISPTEQTNWLIDMSPMLYLYGGLHFLYLFVMDQERAEYWRQKLQGEVERVQNLSDKSEYSGTSLTVRCMTMGV